MDKLEKKLRALGGAAFWEGTAQELGQRLLEDAARRTPVGAKKGGRLRSGWEKKGRGKYAVLVENATEYASYVEEGHRKRGGKGRVPGQRFLAQAEAKLRREAAGIVERRLRDILR